MTLPNGRSVVLRPIAPDDKEQLVAAFNRLSPESRYRRFFQPIQRLSDDDLVYLTEVDHHDHEALVALDAETGWGVGVARYVRSAAEPDVAEVAVTVVDDWQHMGVGTLLLSHLVDRARAEGIRRFSALVQGDNAQVLELIRPLGEVRMESRGAELLLDIDLPDELSRKRLQATLREIAGSRVQVTRRPPTAELNDRAL